MTLFNKIDIPSSIKSLPQVAQDFFMETYKKLYKGDNEATAFAIAWKATKSRLKKSEGCYVAMTEDFVTPEIYTFDLSFEPSGLIMNTANEELVMEAVLANTDFNSKGQAFTEVELNEIAEQINTFGSGMPDVDHEKLKELAAKFGNNQELILQEIKKEKGIFKSIKALVHNGKLWIQQHLDKRYKNKIEKYNKLSIEVFANVDKNTGRLSKPKYLGYTLTSNPSIKSLPAASIVA